MCESESFTKIPGMCAQQQGTFLKSDMIWVDSVCDLLAYMLVNYAGSPRFSNPAG
jgi:hypothetical protein